MLNEKFLGLKPNVVICNGATSQFISWLCKDIAQSVARRKAKGSAY